jgi:DNA polymerase-3 subunit delta
MIFFFYGGDTWRSRKKLNELKEKFSKDVDPSGNSIVEVGGESSSLEMMRDAISPQSLFSRKMMVVIKDVFSNKKPAVFEGLSKIISERAIKINGNAIVFFESSSDIDKKSKEKKAFFELLLKEKYSQEFKEMAPADISAWITDEAAQRGGSISRETARELMSIVGNDTWALSNEIDKLISYKKSLSTVNNSIALINAEDLKTISGSYSVESIFALTDAIGTKNKGLALKIFEDQVASGSNELQILSMVIKHIKNIIQIKSALDADYSTRKITSQLKLHPFVAQKGILQARNFSIDQLKDLYSALIRSDFLAKSGKQNVKTSLSLVISKS